MTVFAKITAAGLLAAALAVSAGDWEAQRAAAVNRQRKVILNTDGGNTYISRKLPATKENFCAQRLVHCKDGRVDSVFYSPLTAYTLIACPTETGDFLTADTSALPDSRNAAREFAEQGTDPLKMTGEFCRENKLEFFLSVRVNDTHDAAVGKDNSPHFKFSPFKQAHPEYLMGTPEARPPWCTWSAVDYARPEVRGRFVRFIAEFAAKYDLDGIELDFMRHAQLLKSVANGGQASPEELAMLTSMMKEIRDDAETIGKKRGRPILIAIRTPDSAEYCRAIGIDLETWFKLKLVDIWIGGAYFQLKPWHDSVELAKKYGVKFYASIGSESRIERRPDSHFIPGRGNTLEFYHSTIAAALREGCDGVYFFNSDYLGADQFKRFVSGDMADVANTDKRYYATERGSGGYEPAYYLAEGYTYSKLPLIDPAYPRPLAPGAPLKFRIVVGDDLEAAAKRGKETAVTAKIRSEDAGGAKFTFAVNGKEFPESSRDGEVVIFKLDPAVIRPGSNDFAVGVAPDPERQGKIVPLIAPKPPVARQQRPWLRPFGNLGIPDKEKMLPDSLYEIADRETDNGSGLFYPLEIAPGAPFTVDFQLQVKSSDAPDAVALRVANGAVAETIAFEPGRITSRSSGRSAKFDTASELKSYRLIFADGKLTLLNRKQKLLEETVTASPGDPAVRLPGDNPAWNSGVFIGSLSLPGRGAAAWHRKFCISFDHVKLNDFFLEIKYADKNKQ
ncbi:MAG: hypothetical protein AB7F32_01605 [Victivallaceae bacterium]